MALIFVRHGSTSLNAGDPSDPKDYFRGWSDAPLSDYGAKTVGKTAKWLSQLPISQIVSSDLPRAMQTAQIISQATNAPVTPDSRLRPLNVGMLTAQEITPTGKKLLDQAHEDRGMVIPGGESYNDFLTRYKSILPELLNAAQNQHVVVVAHHRNTLALPELFYGQKAKTTDSTVPGTVLALTKSGVKTLYSPPGQEQSYKDHAQS